jgi:kynurenine formamidase
MIAHLLVDNSAFVCDLSAGRSIAIPLRFGGPQPNAYDVPPAIARPFEAGAFIGDTRRGGSCNFDTVTLTPHCNGTHTECIGHIALERISVDAVLTPGLLPATLITVTPAAALEVDERYEPAKEDADRMITAAALRAAMKDGDIASASASEFHTAMVIRTLPNERTKCSRRYTEHPAPFFSIEAMLYLRELGVEHLLVDIPSLDRAFDDGRMIAHHTFWDVPPGSHDIAAGNPAPRTVTEMIFVEDDIPDGRYLVDLQIAPFVADAAPSRPVLFHLTPSSTEE